jgi:hypothetical protein
VSSLNAVPPAPCPLSTPHPSKRDSDALEERTAANPAPIQDNAMTQGEWSTSSLSLPTLCGHHQPCAPLWGHPRRCGSLLIKRRHAGPCAAQVPPSARPSNWRTSCNQTHVLRELPSKPSPGEYMAATTSARIRIHQDDLRSQVLCTDTTTLCKNPCGASSPWSIKGGGGRPAAGDHLHSHSLAHDCSPDISTHPNHLPGTWRLLLFSRLACSPPL